MLPNGYLITFRKYRSSHLRCSIKKLFYLIQDIPKFLRASNLKNNCEQLLLKMCSWNWEKPKKYSQGVLTLHLKKTGFFNIIIWNKWQCLFLFHDIGFPWSLYSHAIFIWYGEKYWAYLGINSLEFYAVCFYYMPSWEHLKLSCRPLALTSY